MDAYIPGNCSLSNKWAEFSSSSIAETTFVTEFLWKICKLLPANRNAFSKHKILFITVICSINGKIYDNTFTTFDKYGHLKVDFLVKTLSIRKMLVPRIHVYIFTVFLGGINKNVLDSYIYGLIFVNVTLWSREKLVRMPGVSETIAPLLPFTL